MTTIAVTKTQIAGDKMLSHSNGITFQSSGKIVVIDDDAFYKTPFAVGLAGDVELCLEILDFFRAPLDWKSPKSKNSAEFVVLTADRKIFTFSNPKLWLPVTDRFYAIGSGSHFAMGAMAAGASALDAVKIAKKLDKGTGSGITHFEF